MEQKKTTINYSKLQKQTSQIEGAMKPEVYVSEETKQIENDLKDIPKTQETAEKTARRERNFT